MGTYTRCYFSLKLRSDTPDAVKTYVHSLAYDKSYDWKGIRVQRTPLIRIFNHALFHTEDRWLYVFSDGCRLDDEYGDTSHAMVTECLDGSVLIDAISMIKNYDGVVAKFVGFLHPFLDPTFNNYAFLGMEERLYYDDRYRYAAYVILGKLPDEFLKAYASTFKFHDNHDRIQRWRWRPAA